MSFTGRMRIALLLVGIVPLIVAVVALTVFNRKSSEQLHLRQVTERIEAARSFIQRDLDRRGREALQLARSQIVARAARRITSGATEPRLEIPGHAPNLVELIDSDGIILANISRPGLIGQPTALQSHSRTQDTVVLSKAKDRMGSHAAICAIESVNDDIRLVAFWYIDSAYTSNLAYLLDANVRLVGSDDQPDLFGRAVGQLYESEEGLEANLTGDSTAGFVMMAQFRPVEEAAGTSTMLVIVIVSALALVVAVSAGWYLTGKAQREVDNLLQASRRIADGDFNTPVMAYEEGEFSDLADSLSETMTRLKQLRLQLTEAERIAAWQAVGRTVAHEVRNPLTPIAVSVDDLRQSYRDKLPDFDGILEETTSMIKSELNRLTRLLDEFVGFARLRSPDLRLVSVNSLFEAVGRLYASESARGRVTIASLASDSSVELDDELIQQALVNLIKNALESGRDTRVQLSASFTDSSLYLTVSDNGPGFPEDVIIAGVAPKESTKKSGYGLGLALCRRIIADHGGTLELVNTDQGAEARIELPRTHG